MKEKITVDQNAINPLARRRVRYSPRPSANEAFIRGVLNVALGVLAYLIVVFGYSVGQHLGVFP